MCLVQRTNTRFGDHSFAVAGPRLEYGTVCQASCESQTLHSDNSDEHSKRIYLVTDSCSIEWQCFSHAVYKFADLLTYIRNCDIVYGPTVLQLQLKSGSGQILFIGYPNPVLSLVLTPVSRELIHCFKWTNVYMDLIVKRRNVEML